MKIKNLILTALGFVFLGLGAIGVVLPVMPTTPFVLLASLSFSVGSKRFSAWLRRSRIFGPYIEHYRTKQGIGKPLKIASIIFLWAGLILSMAMMRTPWGYAILGAIGALVTVHLLLIKTKPGPPSDSETASFL